MILGTSTDITVVFGYPEATSAALTQVVSGLTADWTLVNWCNYGCWLWIYQPAAAFELLTLP
ncbi:hypothetical protein OH492_22445 [Vibrio chagasii]|nr:hypothetical protein [Vibrio chagasii]